ncbi:sialin-like isoform X2 [Drosophila hydei]|uniref:Sialin-like isoform X2 n=1 Tax=Drosophila hydei TaxID=7224 RepID=A0A6J1LD05_DROHY|nr:sialin-like isoform X2 [Drosophila hydei]
MGLEYLFVTLRPVHYIHSGPLFPALASLLSHWVPPKERSTLGALCYSGVSVGIVASNLGSGFIIHYFTWALCLIIFGAATFCWMIVFILICASTPDKHLCIRKGEKDYLKKHISMQTESLTIPWHKILFSKALIALAISQIGHDWAFCLIVSYLPKYMADVLQFSILSNGLWTSLPFVALWFSSLICGFLADWLIRTGTMSITVERKVFTFISAFGPGAFMVIASYVECRKSLAVLFFTLSMFMMGPFYAGQKLTPIDMSPTYAGILTAICNGAGAVSGLLCPSIIGIMTPDRTTGQWRYVFWLSFAISVSSAIVFALWGSSDLQAYDPRAQRIRRRTKSHIPLDVFA